MIDLQVDRPAAITLGTELARLLEGLVAPVQTISGASCTDKQQDTENQAQVGRHLGNHAKVDRHLGRHLKSSCKKACV